MFRNLLTSIAITTLIAGNTLAISFNHVVTLGDSLFDDTTGTRSPVAPEYVAEALDVGLTKFARSGATSSSLISSGQHTRAAAEFGAGDLAMLWIGGNDFGRNTLSLFLGLEGFLDTLESNVNTALSTLTNDGMDVLVFNLPDMADVPLINSILFTDLALENATEATLAWNARLDNLAAMHGATVVDIYSLFEELENDPDKFSLLGNQPVLGSVGCQFCVFADGLHPSAFAQGFIANEVIEVINRTYDPQGTMPLEPLVRYEIAALAGVYAANFDGNNLVDARDLQQWLFAYGKTTLADANGNGVTDGSDFLIWQRQITPAPALAVPEPAVAMLLLSVATSCGLLRRTGRLR